MNQVIVVITLLTILAACQTAYVMKCFRKGLYNPTTPVVLSSRQQKEGS